MTERGSLTVEAALVVPVILLVVVAVMEAVMTAGTHLQMVAAAREGVRVAATAPDPAMAVDAVRSALPRSIAALTRVSVERPAEAGRPAVVVVRMERPLATPLLTGITIPLRARAAMAVEP